MFSEYIQAALESAKYDTLEDDSYVAIVPGLQGVIAVGDLLKNAGEISLRLSRNG